MVRLLATVLPNVIGAALVYFYFNRVDPTTPGPPARPITDLVVFGAVVGITVFGTTVASAWHFGPLQEWRNRLREGADAALVPAALRRRVLNAPLAHALFSFSGWLAAAVFYFPYQMVSSAFTAAQSARVFFVIALVAGPVASALSFLVGEFYWRRDVPYFFPGGRLERAGVLRVPILARLAATFLVTSVLPPLLMMMVSFSLEHRFGGEIPGEMRPLWTQLLRTQMYIVSATGVVSVVMATLVARFINRPIQALRAAMAGVAAGDLDVRAPVRSTDELGELNDRFNAMVNDLRQGARLRELFGRYVSPAVARQALERGIALGGEATRATAMFVDLRGFTALAQRLPAARVVELLNEYYAIVERVCEQEGGVITQFLGDGVVIVFGGPLRPLPDHARHALRAAIALQHALRERNAARDGEPLEAGIGICTGDMVAGNVGAGGRVTYTIVGDAVNQAARLQVKTRELGAPILLTESTRAALGEPDGFPLRARGSVPLKGIAAPVEVYAVEA